MILVFIVLYSLLPLESLLNPRNICQSKAVSVASGGDLSPFIVIETCRMSRAPHC